MNIDICFDCLFKQKPYIAKDKVVFYSQPSQCSKCGENKQLVFNFSNGHGKKLFNVVAGDIKIMNYIGIDVCDKFEFTLQTLANDVGWNEVRDRYMYIQGQEAGKPLAFRTIEEYEPYLNCRVVELGNRIIIQKHL